MIEKIRKLNPYTIPIVLILVAGFAYFSVYINSVVKWVPYPNQIDFGEGMTMDVAKLWANGEWKWDVNIPPYLTLMHGMIMPIILTPLIKIFGWSLGLGRGLMVLATLISCGFLFLIGKEISKKWYIGLIAALLPFTQPTIRDWSLMARPDMLAIMFSIIGIWWIIKYEKKNNWMVYLSLIFFWLAMLTKLSALSGIGATLLYLLISNRRIFIRYLGLFILSFGLFALGDKILNNGEYLRHIITYNSTNPVFQVQDVLARNLLIVIIPLFMIIMVSLIYGIRKIIKERKLDVLICYFFGTLVIDFATATRAGSFINYYVEFIFLACLCAALMIPFFVERSKEEFKKKKLGLNGVIVGLIVIQPLIIYNMVNAFPFPNKAYDHDVTMATEIIKHTNKPVPTENAGLVLNAGKEPLIEPFVFTNMTRLGLWDETNYLNGYKNQEYDFIILRIPMYLRPDGDGHFPKEVAHAITNNYSIIYEPDINFYWYGLTVYQANRLKELNASR